jgi:hypothetical protein
LCFGCSVMCILLSQALKNMATAPCLNRYLVSATLAALLLIPCLGCKTKSFLSVKEPTILTNDGSNVFYAKEVCASKLQTHTDICIDDPTGEVRDYESQIATAFAADPTCHGLKLIGTNPAYKFTQEVVENAEWQLGFNYVPGDSKQNWTVSNRKTLEIVATGTENAKATAHTLSARGASS